MSVGARLFGVLMLLFVVLPAGASAGPLDVWTCSGQGSDIFTTASADFATARSCELEVARAGTAVVVASASVGLNATGAGNEFRVATRVGVDDLNGSPSSERQVDIATDATDGTDKTVAHTSTFPVAAGNHTFRFVARRAAGAGTVRMYAPQLTVLFVPDGSRAKVCGGNTPALTTTSASYVPAAQCDVTAAEPSRAYVVGSGGLRHVNDSYEARINVNLDSTMGNVATDRWINITGAAGNTHKAVMTQFRAPLAAGQHTVSLLGVRYNGAGTMQMDNPSVAAIVIPNTWTRAKGCSSDGNTVYNTSETSFQTVRSCIVDVPADGGTALAFGSASAGIADGGQPYEARFRLGFDAPTGNADTDRWVNTYADGGDGVDEGVAISRAGAVAAGARTFSMLATRYNGTGPLQVYDPGLMALWFATPDNTAPAIDVTGRPDALTNSETADITWTVDDAAATVTCAVDGQAAAPCAGALNLTGLDDGDHSVVITATDESGNESEETVNWTVDTAAPVVTVADGAPTGTRTVKTATIGFSVNDAAATTTCKLDAAPAAPCASPVDYADLAEGPHTVVIAATDTAGNTGEATVTWTVDTVAPVITVTEAPGAETAAATARIAFTLDDAAATATCALDGAAAAPCAGQAEYADLAAGKHEVVITATDAAGNTATTTVTWTRTVPAEPSPTPTATQSPTATPTPSPTPTATATPKPDREQPRARRCFGQRATIVAERGQRRVVGTPGDDVIVGTNGDDVIIGRGGDDRICTRNGADRVKGGKGDDRISGGRGKDVLRGGRGADLLTGAGARDRLFGGPGSDYLRSAGSAEDLANCGPGRDRYKADRFDVVRRCERRA